MNRFEKDYSGFVLEAKYQVANENWERARHFYYLALRYAMFSMMEPIGSHFVQSAIEGRALCFRKIAETKNVAV